MRAVLVASVIGASACAVVVLCSFLPVVPPLPPGAWLPLFVGIFAVFPVPIIASRRSALRPLLGADTQELARRYWWLGLAGLVTMIAFITSVPSLQGQPTIVHGGYFLDDHGTLIRVSHDTYLRALAANERFFTGIACSFYAAAAAMCHALGAQSSSAHATGGTSWPG